MRIFRWFVIAGVAAAVVTPTEQARAQDYYVWAFQGTTGQDVFPAGSGAAPYIRRGRTSTVRIVKHLIDLTPNVGISVSGGGATISNITRGQFNGTGYVQMDVAVPGGTAVGTDVTINVGFDHFKLDVVRNAIVNSMTGNPVPSTVQAGTQWTLSVQGTDLGAPSFKASSPACHNVQITAQNNTSITANLTRNASCTQGSFAAELQAIAGQTPARYRTPGGNEASFPIVYAPPPPSGVTCVSRPDIGSPVVTSPQNGASISFGAATPSPTNIQITWQANTQPNNVPAPLNEFVITRTTSGKTGSTTVTGTSKTLAFSIPGTHTLSIRAKNCGQPAPATTLTFSTRYQ